jgi:hypothetical protein
MVMHMPLMAINDLLCTDNVAFLTSFGLGWKKIEKDEKERSSI